jgi:threonyl-tRNA synthetase
MSFLFDHRQLAKEMDLYYFDESVGAGLPMWLPNGVAIREALEEFIKKKERHCGYRRVSSPGLGREELYQKSGHLKWYKDDMFPSMALKSDQLQLNQYYLRPMNCPHHHQYFSHKKRSYQELPLRFAEYGQVYRNEASGALRGLSRVRGLCQNDGHIYVGEWHVKEELSRVLNLHLDCYRAIGIEGFRFRLSKHDPLDIDSNDSRAMWIKCENILREVLQEAKVPFFEAAGEAAFYGPKIDVQMQIYSECSMQKIKEESISSIQLDFLSSERFDLSFVNKEGRPERPFVIHRAPLGSHERFIAMLLEYFDGNLPAWLAPVQVNILSVGADANDYCKKMHNQLLDLGIRVALDDRDMSLGKKMALSYKFKPHLNLVIGKKEVEANLFSLNLLSNAKKMNEEELMKFFVSYFAIPS